MSGNVEDDWEKAEAAMNSLSLVNEGSAKEVINPVPEEETFDSLDSAIQNALNNPKERMACLQIEDIIVKFMRSGDPMMEVPPGLSSFRRLLTHRVGDRFGLQRSISNSANELGERGLVLYRTAETRMPRRLIIDLAAPSPSASPSPVADTSSSASGAAAAPAGGEGGGRKILLMKRRGGDGAAGLGGRSGKNTQVQSAEDREKAYLEARARIFGEEADGEAGAAEGAASPAAVASPPPTTATAAAARPSPSPSPSPGPSEEEG
eukprot:gene44718-54688_t